MMFINVYEEEDILMVDRHNSDFGITVGNYKFRPPYEETFGLVNYAYY